MDRTAGRPAAGPDRERRRPVLPCTVWLARSEWERPAHAALLDPAETARRARFRPGADRASFTVAAALLRLVVARETGVAPGSVRVDRACRDCGEPHGRPRVPGSGLHVSVSHSGGRVAVAVSRAGPVGVDVEAVTRADVAALARSVLAPTEPVRRARDFFAYWCRKESVVKATGDGLQASLAEVVVSPAGEPARLLSYRGAPLPAAMADLSAGPGYAGAVTVLADGWLDPTVLDAAGLLAPPAGGPGRRSTPPPASGAAGERDRPVYGTDKPIGLQRP